MNLIDLATRIASEDDQDDFKSDLVKRFVVQWDWDQNAYDRYLDYHDKYPDDPNYFYTGDSMDVLRKPFKTLDDARKWAKKKMKGVEGDDYVITEREMDSSW
jgi:hypothetical protein